MTTGAERERDASLLQAADTHSSLNGSFAARISLSLIGLAWLAPFLYYRHVYPHTSYYQEWSAALLGVAALFLLAMPRLRASPDIPRIALLPLGLALVAVLQYTLGRIIYLDQVLLYVLYLFWAAMLMVLGRALRRQLGWPALAGMLAVCLLAGAELSALLGILQHYRWHTFLDPVLTVKVSAAVYGNLAQPNHYASYISMGLASLALLHGRWSLRAWQTAVLAVPLLFVLVLSGSRSAWFYLLCFASLSILWQRRDKAYVPWLRYGLLLLAGYAAMHFVVQIPVLAGADGTVTALQRMQASEPGSGAIRLALWHKAGLIFSGSPWLGAGLGQFAWQHFQLVEQLRDADVPGLYTHAHNLVLHIAAETGLAGLLLLLASLWLWLIQAVRRGVPDIHTGWAYFVLAVIGIHSLLEYPLWYAYFLGMAAILLGAADHTVLRRVPPRRVRLAAILTLLAGMPLLLMMAGEYREIEQLLARRPGNVEQTGAWREKLQVLATGGMNTSLAELNLAGMPIKSPADAVASPALTWRAVRAHPTNTVVYNHAIVLALSGDREAARLQMARSIWSYPGDFERVRRDLEELAMKDSAHFSDLLEFAVLEYEGRQHAIHSK